MSDPVNKLETTLLELKLSWYEKLQKKLFEIESGEISIEQYSKEVMEKAFEMKNEIHLLKKEL